MPLKSADQQRDDVQYQQFQPDPGISEYVDRILYGHAPGGIGHEISIPPSGGVFISYVIGSPIKVKFSDRIYDRRPKLFIGGQLKTESPVLIPEDDFGLIGFQLTPTGFYKLFGINTSTLTDDIKDLEELDATGSRRILDVTATEADKELVIKAMTNYILTKDKPEVDCGRVDHIAHYITVNQGNVRVSDLVGQYDMTERGLRREFLEKVGLSPKYFAKIIQLNAITELLTTHQEEKLNQMALSCGYYDQAHFIRDFQKYLGMNPMAFVRSEDSFLRTFLSKRRH